MAPDGEGRATLVRERLAREGLHIVVPLGQTAFDDASVGAGGPRMRDLLPSGTAAVLVGDGGGDFFARFEASTGNTRRPTWRDPRRNSWMPGGADPLDDYTRDVMNHVAADLRAAGAFDREPRILHPFVNARPALPFQRLGQAAGLPPPGPLGIQIHPVYGPWWAYRALLIVSEVLGEPIPVAPSCPDCARPCVGVCPGRAVLAMGFAAETCSNHRRWDPACRSSCIARIRCPVGAEHRYPAAQLAFHMDASMRT